jgi:DNA modification methylase
MSKAVRRSSGDVLAALARASQEPPFTAKRPTGRPAGVEAWFPYYAGYTMRFAEQVLKAADLPEGAVVLDPWNGAGTTTHVADRLGLTGRGFDINPVAALVASARLAHARDAEHVLGLARRVSEAALKSSETNGGRDALDAWLPPAIVNHYRAIERAILSDLATGPNGTAILPGSGALPPLAAFLVLALMRAARAVAKVHTTTNPTWIRPGLRRKSTRRAFANRWLTAVQEMARDLATRARAANNASECALADSRALPLDDGAADFVLTSPPYCTRIDYVVNSSFELAALGVRQDSAEFAALRRASMGTPLARPGLRREPAEHWPQPVQDLLRTIREHESKASASYYYKTYEQYFRDCEASLREVGRTLHKGGVAVLVVQSSYYKNILVDLPELYLEIGRGLGLRGSMLSSAEVRKALSQINARSSVHRATSTYREAVLALEKAG